MRYGHLLAGFIFFFAFAILGAMLWSRSRDRIDVVAPPGLNSSGSRENTAAVNPPAANPVEGYYTEPARAFEATVVYGPDGFSPAVLTVPLGTTIRFENRSAQVFWPASDPHPAHTLYPVSGGCIGSVFDACAPVAPGQVWTFRFDRRGSWSYHDHLIPGHTGKVVIQ